MGLLKRKGWELPIWIARAASSWVLYLTKPKPLSRWTRTSSMTPAPSVWNMRCRSSWVTCNIDQLSRHAKKTTKSCLSVSDIEKLRKGLRTYFWSEVSYIDSGILRIVFRSFFVWDWDLSTVLWAVCKFNDTFSIRAMFVLAKSSTFCRPVASDLSATYPFTWNEVTET